MGIDLCCSFFSNIEGAGETAFCFDLKNGPASFLVVCEYIGCSLQLALICQHHLMGSLNPSLNPSGVRALLVQLNSIYF